MPRKVRELVNGGIYHVYNRGNDKMPLFREPSDFRYFLKRFREVKELLGAQVFHYCIMQNHFHFLLQVHRGPDLIILMHRTQLAYARYFKRKYDFVGHVFQERFRSPRIPNDSYYLQCGRYIERNPVKAGLVKSATEYPYSSAGFYGFGTPDTLITCNMLYEQMGKHTKDRQQNYRHFLAMKEPYEAMIEPALAAS